MPHEVHDRASRAPQPLQNLLPAGFSIPQLAQGKVASTMDLEVCGA
jgi:hypothetical protein